MANPITPYAGGAELAAASSEDELDPRSLLRAFWRRKWIFLGTVVLITSAALIYAFNAQPLYRAEALLRIQSEQEAIIDLPEIGGRLEADDPTIESEIELLESRAFAGRMVDRLGLIEDPEFNPALEPDEPLSLFGRELQDLVPQPLLEVMPGFLREGFGDESKPLPVARPSAKEAERARVRTIQAFSKALSVGQVSRSYVLEIGFVSSDPAKAARIADAVAEAYIVRQLEAKYAAAEQAREWLRERVEELRDKVIAAEQKIVRYQGEAGIAGEGNVDIVEQQIAQLNVQLATARAARAEAEARDRQVQALMGSPGGVSAAANVLTSPLMDQLRAQETDLIRRLSEVATVYGERHPQMVNVRAELRSVRQKMNEEVRRIVQDLGNELAVASAREQELEGAIAALEERVRGRDVSSVELRDFEREAASARDLYQTFLQRLREVTASQDLQRADAKILSSAQMPLDPFWPRKKLILLVAFAGAVILGSVLVFIVERWDSDFGFRSADELQAVLGLRALALIPDLTRRELRKATPEEYILERPQSAYAEAVQRARTAIFLSNRERATRSVLVTSSTPVEGKSSLSASLARQSACAGLRTILIDADLRRPRLHNVIGTDNRNGLADLLYGDLALAEAVRRDERSGLAFVPAGIAPVSPPDLFRSSTMHRLLDELAVGYDLVIIDSPPVVAVSDSLILSELVDKTIYVVRWSHTPRKTVAAGIRQVAEAGGDLAGVVLSRVDVKKHAQYGYADSGAYSGEYGRYYIN